MVGRGVKQETEALSPIGCGLPLCLLSDIWSREGEGNNSLLQSYQFEHKSVFSLRLKMAMGQEVLHNLPCYMSPELDGKNHRLESPHNDVLVGHPVLKDKGFELWGEGAQGR